MNTHVYMYMYNIMSIHCTVPLAVGCGWCLEMEPVQLEDFEL